MYNLISLTPSELNEAVLDYLKKHSSTAAEDEDLRVAYSHTNHTNNFGYSSYNFIFSVHTKETKK